MSVVKLNVVCVVPEGNWVVGKPLERAGGGFTTVAWVVADMMDLADSFPGVALSMAEIP